MAAFAVLRLRGMRGLRISSLRASGAHLMGVSLLRAMEHFQPPCTDFGHFCQEGPTPCRSPHILRIRGKASARKRSLDPG